MKNLPPLVPDPVIEAYKKDVDRTLLRENLKLTVEERLTQMYEFMRSLDDFRGSLQKPAKQ
ncbi:MAG: hypothetical protein WBC44_18440 [Planctomycetaceae bacterium]